MKVTTDESGYVTGWALIGDNGGVDVSEPEDLDGFMQCFSGYRLSDGMLVKDDEKDAATRLEQQKEQLRSRRKDECFTYVNRGQLWYTALSVKQLAELTAWYKAWLNVTDTLTVPDKPSWLEDY